jgi:hypothetical protein
MKRKDLGRSCRYLTEVLYRHTETEENHENVRKNRWCYGQNSKRESPEQNCTGKIAYF